MMKDRSETNTIKFPCNFQFHKDAIDCLQKAYKLVQLKLNEHHAECKKANTIKEKEHKLKEQENEKRLFSYIKRRAGEENDGNHKKSSLAF